jgi:hypothetical protein
MRVTGLCRPGFRRTPGVTGSTRLLVGGRPRQGTRRKSRAGAGRRERALPTARSSAEGRPLNRLLIWLLVSSAPEFANRTKSAIPVAIALRGIDGYSASSGSCTRVVRPQERIDIVVEFASEGFKPTSVSTFRPAQAHSSWADVWNGHHQHHPGKSVKTRIVCPSPLSRCWFSIRTGMA